MIKIGIYGAKGRMGKQIEECLKSETQAQFRYFMIRVEI